MRFLGSFIIISVVIGLCLAADKPAVPKAAAPVAGAAAPATGAAVPVAGAAAPATGAAAPVAGAAKPKNDAAKPSIPFMGIVEEGMKTVQSTIGGFFG